MHLGGPSHTFNWAILDLKTGLKPETDPMGTVACCKADRRELPPSSGHASCA